MSYYAARQIPAAQAAMPHHMPNVVAQAAAVQAAMPHHMPNVAAQASLFEEVEVVEEAV